MTTIFFVFVMGMCVMLGVKTLNAEEQNTVFCKHKVPVQDVKKYNRFCGWLIIGFGIAAGFTMVLMDIVQGWVSYLFPVVLIVEAVILMKIYREGEKKMLRKR